MLLLSTGCAGIGNIRSQVLDAQTKQPIAGAVVLGVWTRVAGVPGLTHTELVGVKEVETDARGQFEMDRPVGLGVEESVTVYRFGFVAWNNQEVFPTFKSRKSTGIPNQILLEVFPPGESHQKHLMFIRDAMSSSMHGIERRPEFEKAIDREYRMP